MTAITHAETIAQNPRASSRSEDRIGTSDSFGESDMAIGLPGFGRRFYVVGSVALSVTILASGSIFASRPLAGSGEVRQIFSKELPNVPGKALTAVQVDTLQVEHRSRIMIAALCWPT